jgi:hypothetical protein
MVEIDSQKRLEAIDRFVSLAGLSGPDAKTLVDAALQAAIDQTLDTIMGSGPVPSAMTATRAEGLRYVCLQAGRVLTQREVGVLFRTTPSNARSILTTMSATYEQALHHQFVTEMRGAATVEQIGTLDQGLRWSVRFSQRAAFDTARAELERLGLLKLATFDDAAWTVEFEQSVKTPQDEIDVLARLGLEPPQSGGRRAKK